MPDRARRRLYHFYHWLLWLYIDVVDRISISLLAVAEGKLNFLPPPVRLLPKLFPFFHFPVTCCCFSGNGNAKVLIESKPSGNHLRMREATHAFLKFWNFLVIGGQGLIIDLPIICNQNESSWPTVFWYLFGPFSINLFLMILNSR